MAGIIIINEASLYNALFFQVPSQEALTEGIVPPFYANKVQLSYSVDNAPTHIFLCILHLTVLFEHNIMFVNSLA